MIAPSRVPAVSEALAGDYNLRIGLSGYSDDSYYC